MPEADQIAFDRAARMRLKRESVGRQWRSRLASEIMRSEDDEVVGEVAEALGCACTAWDFAVANGLEWPEDS